MMFNIPIVGGSSAHAVGAVFIAILLGPWAAVISVTTALLIQALVFGDGGIMSFGINCFNMAVVMPFSGYFVYKILAGQQIPTAGLPTFCISPRTVKNADGLPPT
jgi:cobalt/nickel transport system permease protein